MTQPVENQTPAQINTDITSHIVETAAAATNPAYRYFLYAALAPMV